MANTNLAATKKAMDAVKKTLSNLSKGKDPKTKKALEDLAKHFQKIYAKQEKDLEHLKKLDKDDENGAAQEIEQQRIMFISGKITQKAYEDAKNKIEKANAKRQAARNRRWAEERIQTMLAFKHAVMDAFGVDKSLADEADLSVAVEMMSDYDMDDISDMVDELSKFNTKNINKEREDFDKKVRSALASHKTMSATVTANMKKGFEEQVQKASASLEARKREYKQAQAEYAKISNIVSKMESDSLGEVFAREKKYGTESKFQEHLKNLKAQEANFRKNIGTGANLASIKEWKYKLDAAGTYLDKKIKDKQEELKAGKTVVRIIGKGKDKKSVTETVALSKDKQKLIEDDIRYLKELQKRVKNNDVSVLPEIRNAVDYETVLSSFPSFDKWILHANVSMEVLRAMEGGVAEAMLEDIRRGERDHQALDPDLIAQHEEDLKAIEAFVKKRDEMLAPVEAKLEEAKKRSEDAAAEHDSSVAYAKRAMQQQISLEGEIKKNVDKIASLNAELMELDRQSSEAQEKIADLDVKIAQAQNASNKTLLDSLNAQLELARKTKKELENAVANKEKALDLAEERGSQLSKSQETILSNAQSKFQDAQFVSSDAVSETFDAYKENKSSGQESMADARSELADQVYVPDGLKSSGKDVLKGIKRKSIEKTIELIDEDDAKGRLLKGLFAMKTGFGKSGLKGAAKGLLGSVGNDIHKSINKWKDSGGLGRKVVGGLLDGGLKLGRKWLANRAYNKAVNSVDTAARALQSVPPYISQSKAFGERAPKYLAFLVQLRDLLVRKNYEDLLNIETYGRFSTLVGGVRSMDGDDLSDSAMRDMAKEVEKSQIDSTTLYKDTIKRVDSIRLWLNSFGDEGEAAFNDSAAAIKSERSFFGKMQRFGASMFGKASKAKSAATGAWSSAQKIKESSGTKGLAKHLASKGASKAWSLGKNLLFGKRHDATEAAFAKALDTEVPKLAGGGVFGAALKAGKGKIAKVAGGIANRVKKGVLARFGEAGAEAVIPLQGRGAKIVAKAMGKEVAQNAGKAGGMQYESAQHMEERQKAAENQAKTTDNVATIVRLLEEQNKLAKQKKPESLLSKILGFIGMMATVLLPKIIGFIKFVWKGISLAVKIIKPIAKLLFKIGGPLLRILGMLGKGLFGLLGKLGKGAGALLSGAKEGAAKLWNGAKAGAGKLWNGAKAGAGKLGSKIGGALGKAGGLAKGLAKGILGKLGPIAMIGMGLYDAYKGWNDEDFHKRAFGLKDGEKASTGQKIQAGMAHAASGLTFGLVDPETFVEAYQNPLKSFGKMITGLTDGIPILGDAVKGIGNFIESSPMLKGAVDWLDEHNPLKMLTEGIGKTIDWFNSDTKWEDLKSGFKAVGAAITDTCCNVGAWFGEKAQNIGSWIDEKAESAWNFIKENNPIAVTQRGFEKAKDFFDKNAPAAWEFIKENNPIALAKKGFEGVKGFFAEKFGNISNWLSGGNNPFQPIFNFLNSIGEFFRGLTLSGLAQKTGLVPDFLVNWLQEKGLAQGGLVKATKGGTLAVIGEGGEDEAVLPLSKLAQIIYESFKIHDALLGKRSSALGEDSKSIADIGTLAGIIGNGTGTEEPRAGWAIDLLEEIKQIGKNIELMTKMMKLIKVDGITLGELVENKMLAMGGGISGAAAQAAQAAQQAQGMANPASPSYGGGGGQTPMYPAQSGGQGGGVYGAAPFIGGQKAGGVSGKYGAITGMRDELVLPLSQRAKGANGKPMEWSQATNNPGNVGNTDQGRTNIFPDLQSGLRAQAELLQKRYSGMTLLQMCQKYTPTMWQTAIKTWRTSGIKDNEVPNLGDPGTMARLLKAIHKAEGSSKWVPEEEVDYALGLKQMPEGYQKKDYRQLTEKGKALVGKPDQSTPPPQTPGAAGTQAPNPAAEAMPAGAAPSIVPQAKFMPAANGDPYKQTLVPQMPAQQPAAQQSPEASLKGSVSNILQIAQKNASISGKHGYSKENRLGKNQFDCSSFVGRSLQEAGYNVGPISDFTTPKMPAKLGPKGLKFPWTSGLQGIQPGDIAWRNGHTEISIGNGKTIGALNSTAGVGIHPLSWGKYTGYWRPTGAVSGGDQQGQEQQGQSASPQGASPSPQVQPVQPAAGQAPSFVPRPSAPPAGVQPIANPAQSPAIPGFGNPAQQTAQYAQQYQYPPSRFGSGKAESLNASKQQVANLVIAEAKRQGIDPQLALAIAKQESNFNQKDISRAGAVGVMQIMPADVKDYGGGNVYDINDNIRLGVTEIKKKLQLSGGDVREALLRYNWGDGNVRKWKRGARRDMPKEAREYADRVLGHIQKGTVGNILQAAGEAAPSGGINPYAPQQQGNPTIPGLTAGPPVQGMPPQQGPAIPGLSGVYAAMTANAMQRGVKYKLGARNSMTGRVDCSGWTIEMQKQVMQGVQDPEARARLGHVLAGGTAEGIIARGLKYQNGMSASLDPSQIKEGTMIGIKARKGGWGSDRAMGIGHIVTTFRDPNTGRMMVSESTSRGSGGRSGVITTDYEQWYKQHAGRTMWGVDTGALIGGQFDAGNVKAQMEAGGVQQTQYGMGATPQSGPQIQASQQGMVNEQASAYYAQGGGGGNIDASTNINGMPGGGGKKPNVEMVLNKDPMGWIVLQGNAVH